MAEDLYWYGVTLSFECPACRLTSIERIAVSTPEPEDQESIKRGINQQKLTCQLCNTPLAPGVQVGADIRRYTLEHLKQLNIPLPPK